MAAEETLNLFTKFIGLFAWLFPGLFSAADLVYPSLGFSDDNDDYITLFSAFISTNLHNVRARFYMRHTFLRINFAMATAEADRVKLALWLNSCDSSVG